MKKNFLLVASVCVFAIVFGQKNAEKWQAKIEPQKVFIENKGQFDALGVESEILFGTDGYANVFLFSKEGVSYRLEKREIKDADAQENRKDIVENGEIKSEEEKEKEEEENVELVNMQWEGANRNVEVVAVDATPAYFNFSMGKGSINNAKTFKKLIYKNLYPNIDVEYVFHPQTGIEYSLILHPGADISQVKMKYTGADKISLSTKGEIHITTSFGDIIDHAPSTYYDGDKTKAISSSLTLDGEQVSFKLAGYDNSKTVVIDPWTATPSLPTSNKAFYIKTDSVGNAYVYGGTTPFTLLKYNVTGGLVWTYSTAWDTSNSWFGALQVDRAGNSYITSGSVAAIAKISPAGNQVWVNTGSGILNSTEYWAMDFNCDQTQLVVGGTDYSPGAFLNGYVFNINMSNGAVLNKVLVATSSKDTTCGIPIIGCITMTDPDEARAICFSPNGNFYYLTLDTIGSLTTSFGTNFKQRHGYHFSYYNLYGYGFGQGHNGIRASLKYLYTSDGLTLEQRDLNTGAVLNTVSIPGGVSQMSSGIAIDTCGNVYVGSQRTVEKYDANLNHLASKNTPGAVYDVAIGVNGDVLACGQSFAVSLAFNACPQILPICYKVFTANLTPSNPACFGQCSGSASAATTNGTGPYKYLWSNSATTQTVHNLCAGTYNVTVTDLSDNSTAVASTTVAPGSTFLATIVSYPPTCGQNDGKAVANITTGGSLPFTYAWSGGGTNKVDSNLAPGTYTVTVTDAHSCSTTATASLAQTSSLTLSASSTSATCSASNGTASVTVTGNSGPVLYHWSNGLSTSSISGLAAGSYSVTVQDTASTASLLWSEDFTSGGTGWTLNSAGSILTNGPAANQWIINNDTTGCICGSGKYMHITCNSGSIFCTGEGGTCTYLEEPDGFANFTTDVLAISPVISTVGHTHLSLSFNWEAFGVPGADYGLVDLSNDGGATWTALPMQFVDSFNCSLATIAIPGAYENISNFKIAFEWLNPQGTLGGNGANPPGFVVDNIKLNAVAGGACPATATVSVTSTSGLTLNTTSTAASCGLNTGTATASVTGGTGQFTYLWSNSGTTATISNLAGGFYTVTVTGTGNCTAAGSVSVTSSGSALNLSVTPTNTVCGKNNGAATATVGGGNGIYTYAWSNSGTTQTISNLSAGTYPVTVTSNGCTASGFAIIDTSTSLTLSAFGGRAGCTSTGTASVTVIEGIGPFTYLWSNGATVASLSALSAGNYSVTVSGAAGCTVSDTVTVTSAVNGVTLSSASTPSGCSDSTGSATVSATTGTSPFIYAWSNGGTTSSIQNITVGAYTVTVTGTGGCSATASVNVTGSGTFNVLTTTTGAACGGNNGAAEVTNVGGPFTYAWSNGTTTDTIRNLAAGTYTVTVHEGGACSGTASVLISTTGGSVTIQAQPPAVCPGDTSRICAPSGYTTYHWNVGAVTQCINVTQAGNYYVTVTSGGNCTATSNQVTVSINAPDTVSITQHEDTLRATGALTYQWYLNGAPISGATSSMYVATQVGSYYAEGTGSDGCPGKSKTIVLKGITGIGQISDASDVKVYPNPLASGRWHLDVTNDWLGSDCEVYDAAGRLIFRTEIKGTQSEIELNVAQGIYLMRINSAQKNYAIKLIKL